MTSSPSFNLVVISNGISQSIKEEGTLEPFKDFPAFFGAWACRLQTKGDPGGLILWSFFLVVLGYMACNVFRGFLLFVLVTLSSSKVVT